MTPALLLQAPGAEELCGGDLRAAGRLAPGGGAIEVLLAVGPLELCAGCVAAANGGADGAPVPLRRAS